MSVSFFLYISGIVQNKAKLLQKLYEKDDYAHNNFTIAGYIGYSKRKFFNFRKEENYYEKAENVFTGFDDDRITNVEHGWYGRSEKP